MSATSAERPLPRAASDTRARVEGLVPLLGAYLLLSTLYAWQAWRRETPTIFTDELELTQLARSIAETGEPARRGDPYGFSSLVPWLTAPFWWLEPVVERLRGAEDRAGVRHGRGRLPRLPPRAHGRDRAVGVLRRRRDDRGSRALLLPDPRRGAVGVSGGDARALADGAGDRPSDALDARARRRAPACSPSLIRSQLAALLGALAFGVLTLVWRTETMRRWRSAWTTWDWVGGVALAVGAVIALVAFLGHRSGEWEVAATAWKDRMVEYGSWAGGAFAIGIGVLPAIALLAVLAVPASERARPGVRAFVVVTGGAVVSFGWYAAIKGAYLSTAFSSLIVERNLIYLTPLAFVATAYLLMRAAAPVWAVLVVGRGRARDGALGADRPRPRQLPVLRGARARDPRAREPRVGLAARSYRARASSSSCSSRWRRSSPSAPRSAAPSLGVAVPVAIAVAVLAWNVTAEVYAAIGEHDFSARVEANIPKPNDWIDRAAGDGSVVMLGQRLSDNPLGVPTTEFWNRSIEKVWSVDGTGPGPGDTLTPDSQDVDGTLYPDPETDYVLATNGVEVVGEQVAENAAAKAAARPARRPDPASRERDRDRGGRLDARRRRATRPSPPGPRTTASTSRREASAPPS